MQLFSPNVFYAQPPIESKFHPLSLCSSSGTETAEHLADQVLSRGGSTLVRGYAYVSGHIVKEAHGHKDIEIPQVGGGKLSQDDPTWNCSSTACWVSPF